MTTRTAPTARTPAPPPPPPGPAPEPADDVLTRWLTAREHALPGVTTAKQQSVLEMPDVQDFRFTPGNCFFDALTFLLGEAGATADGLRQYVVKVVGDHADLRSRAEPSYEEWARQMRESGSMNVASWADELTLQGAARATGSPIVVLADDTAPRIYRPLRKPYGPVAGVKFKASHYSPLHISEQVRSFVLRLAPAVPPRLHRLPRRRGWPPHGPSRRGDSRTVGAVCQM